MNTLPTYKEQEDKIIQAYFKDEIKPFDSKFCFCGTLNNNIGSWTKTDSLGYSGDDFFRMEAALFKGLEDTGLIVLNLRYENTNSILHWDTVESNQNYETALFNGMVLALEALKQIHIEHGEKIEEPVTLTKRKLQAIT